jgi:hypothetical protein
MEDLLKWSLSFRFTDNNFVCISHFMLAMCPASPIILDFIISPFLEVRAQGLTPNRTPVHKNVNSNFGVPHPFEHTLSRLLEEPSLATTLQGVYCIYFCRYMFRSSSSPSGWIHNYFRKLLHNGFCGFLC